MAKFLILARQTLYYQIEVEAENEAEALTIADDADIDEFDETGELEWDNVSIYRV